MPTVYNKHHKKVPKDAVYVGRPGKWGNPFVIGATDPITGKMMQRERVVELYEQQIMKPEAAEYRALARQELKGKDLVCWCAPKDGFRGKLMCHGQVLLAIANDLPITDVLNAEKFESEGTETVKNDL